MKTCKIVLTGGPCGGKTESLQFITHELRNKFSPVNFVDETANSLLTLGYMPSNNISVFDFQNLLFKIQFLKEYKQESKSKILICDRGLFDGKVYIDETSFQKLLAFNYVKEKEISSTYDIALYFRSIAHEYPNIFVANRIYESPEIGVIRDEMCLDIWKNKILPIDYDNNSGFENKKKIIFSSLRQYLETVDFNGLASLSDYYDSSYINFMLDGINLIMESNNIPDEIKSKTRRLVK